MLVGIVDLAINNLSSVGKAFKEALDPQDSLAIIDENWDWSRPDLVILPGLGKFEAGMEALRDKNLNVKLKDWVGQGTKIVGICLGMQLLGSNSEESPGILGLNLINAKVTKLPVVLGERIPNTGWAETKASSQFGVFHSLTTPGDFYFVHSYHLIPNNDEEILSRSPYGGINFVSSVVSNNVIGFQFHPEKSGKKGKILVSEIVQWARHEN